MSRHYYITYAIAEFCAVRELPQTEAVDLIREVLYQAGQLDAHDNYNDDNERDETVQDVKRIYGRVIGYEA